MIRLAVVLALILALASAAVAGSLTETVRNLAENVLGSGMVKSVRLSANGTVLLRWESATYRAEATLEVARTQLAFEALLATGAILGRLAEISEIRFSIFRGQRLLATGIASRRSDLRLMFAAQLGGGTYVAPASMPDSLKKSTSSDVRPE